MKMTNSLKQVLSSDMVQTAIAKLLVSNLLEYSNDVCDDDYDEYKQCLELASLISGGIATQEDVIEAIEKLEL